MYCTLKIFLTIMVISTLSACVSGGNSTEFSKDIIVLDGIWQVEDIDQIGVVDYSMLTLEFLENSRIAGSTGCNRYSGSIYTDNGAFVVSKVVSTRRACAPAISNQEQRFLAALNEAVNYKIENDTWLVIYDKSGKPRLKLIAITSAQAPQASKMDQSQTQAILYQCEGLGSLSFRFVGPETVDISMDQQREILQLSIAASGAKYVSEGMTFWNKGDEAYLSLPSGDYLCVKNQNNN